MNRKPRTFALPPKHKAIISVCEMLLARMARSDCKQDKWTAELSRDLLDLASRARSMSDYNILMSAIGDILYRHGEDASGSEPMAIQAICDCLAA
jgi:hypothetical protein